MAEISLPSAYLPRLPRKLDPVKRCRVPEDLESVTSVAAEDDPAETGVDAEAVERIWDAARRLYGTGIHPGIQLCVRRHGRIVLDRSIGHARGNGPDDDQEAEKVALSPATPFCIFSASKSVTAMVAHLLDQQGLVHIDDRVAEYIPEFAQHGKDRITINHVLAHRAGVPNVPAEVLDIENIGDDERILRVMCEAEPMMRPGRALAYHAISGGFIIAEIVKRVTGKPIRSYLAEEILDPLGFRWMNYGVAGEDVEQVACNYVTGAPAFPPLSTVLKRALGKHPDEVTAISNDPRFLTGVIPAGNVVTTANELARFFELLRMGGELDGVRIFDQRTIKRALTEQAYRQVDLSLGAPMRHSAGFILGAHVVSLYGPDTDHAFGHLGYTNILGWADPERAISVGLITSGKPLLYPELPDFWRLTRRIGIESPKLPESERTLSVP
jgi:CubicO group peptidase (beta-lactamase class C family)